MKNRRIVTGLLDVYLDTIHPIFPFFCEREIWIGWRDGSFPADESDEMSLACMCALSAQYVGSGALFSDEITATDNAPTAQEFLIQAKRLVPTDFETPCLNQIRSYGMLVLLGAQSNDNAMTHKYLGLYHGLCAHWSLYDEAKWPKGISDCEFEVRRRLWWILYRLEVHTACVFGTMIRTPEAQCSIGYPVGTHHPPFVPGREGQFEDWFAGWNSSTDLFRALEHVIVDLRVRRRRQESVFGSGVPGQTSAFTQVLARIQDDILPHFKSVCSRSTDSGRNRCGFQASNILCTIHLGLMLTALGDEDFSMACRTAEDMMTTISSIPVEYIRAIGSPLHQQLAGVGHMLATLVRKQNLSQTDHEQCHVVLASIIAFLSTFADRNGKAATEHQRLTNCLREACVPVERAACQQAEHSSELETFTWSEDMETVFSELASFSESTNEGELFFMNLTSLSWPYQPCAHS
ncbi:hypothetical protein QM012_001571 [Aureobasidium pullulans]|uniref:Xylanolytic transcriptional activator regulatory domain-containing protein n=1 Tax=Aureobasidium pullulans TaxID=5580 RepID=A0ABR0TEH5_AURPU